MNKESNYRLDFSEMRKLLPHRYPFLLIDSIVKIEPKGDFENPVLGDKTGTRVEARKNVSFNEPYFAGHFPDFPVMPGVLMIETMAQAACFSLYPFFENQLERFRKDFKCILVGVNSARFRKPVFPGDIMNVTTEVIRSRGEILAFRGEIDVSGKRVADAEIMANFFEVRGEWKPQ